MLKVSGVSSDTFGSDNVYGMVRDCTIICGGPDNPKLTFEVSLEDARTEEQNKLFTDGGLAIGEPGLFEAAWVGVDLAGDYLDDLPSHTAFPENTTPSTKDLSQAISGSAR